MIGDITEATGAPVALEIDGTIYTATPLRLMHVGEIVSRVRAARPSTLKTVLASLDLCPAELRGKLLEDAIKEERESNRSTPSGDEIAAWFTTREGAAFVLHVCLRQHHPECTVERCGQLVDAVGDARLLSFLVDSATGLGALGN